MKIPLVVIFVMLGILILVGIRIRSRSAVRDAEEMKAVLARWLETKLPGAALPEKAIRFKAIWTALADRGSATSFSRTGCAAQGFFETLYEESQPHYERLQENLAGMGEPTGSRRIAEIVAEFLHWKG